jgi:hypothetical protein
MACRKVLAKAEERVCVKKSAILLIQNPSLPWANVHSVQQALAKYHPAGLSSDWADKLAGQDFFSRAPKATFEHYMQVGHGSPGLNSVITA